MCRVRRNRRNLSCRQVDRLLRGNGCDNTLTDPNDGDQRLDSLQPTARAKSAPPASTSVPGSGTGCDRVNSYRTESGWTEYDRTPVSSTSPKKLADALPRPVRFTVKFGGASEGRVTGLSRYP